MSRRRFIAFLDANLDLEYVKGQFEGLEVKLVGGHTLHVRYAVDKVRRPEEFLILDNDAEDVVMLV